MSYKRMLAVMVVEAGKEPELREVEIEPQLDSWDALKNVYAITGDEGNTEHFSLPPAYPDGYKLLSAWDWRDLRFNRLINAEPYFGTVVIVAQCRLGSQWGARSIIDEEFEFLCQWLTKSNPRCLTA
jgi:hypothetical protein